LYSLYLICAAAGEDRGDVRGDGYFFGIEMVKDKATKETFNEEESERLLRGFLSGALFEAGLYCHLGDGGAFTLFEFGWRPEQYPPDAVALVAWLRERGMTPILAHPERFSFIQADPGRVRGLVDAGAWLQVTVDSLLGVNGPVPQELGEQFLRDYPDAVLATDAAAGTGPAPAGTDPAASAAPATNTTAPAPPRRRPGR